MVIKKLVWDEWNKNHISKHNVTKEEVEQVCLGRNILNKWKHKTYRVIGQTEEGRYLTIFLSPRINQSYYPITARDSMDRERRVFRKK